MPLTSRTAWLTLTLPVLAAPALAQDHAAHHAPIATTAAAAAPALPTSEAEVRRVDVSAQKITLRHGEIPNLDMPPMTMVFQVPDAALLQGVQAGDRVRFTAELVNGTYTVRSLERLQ